VKMWIMKLFGRQAPGSMTCRHVGEALQEFLDGYIDDERSSRIEAHLEECRRCGMEVEAYERIKATLATKRADLPAESLGRLRDFGERLARGETPPTE
jgi:anti-sigma factor RsiW